jgi:hypothetical protein
MSQVNQQNQTGTDMTQSHNIQPNLPNDPVVKIFPPSGWKMKYWTLVQKSGNKLYCDEEPSPGQMHELLHTQVHKPSLDSTLYKIRMSEYGSKPQKKIIPNIDVKLVPPAASARWKGYMEPRGVLVIPDIVKIMVEPNGIDVFPDILIKNGYKEDKYLIVRIIGEYAFASNKGITDIVIPETVCRIGGNSFCNTNIKDLVLPDSITEIGDGAFSYCTLLSSIKLPNNLQRIGKDAFKGANLKDIIIPESVEYISNATFKDCTSLSSVKLPQRIKSIGNEAFMNTQLIFLDIPESIDIIGYKAFSGIETIRVHSKPFTICEDSFGNNRIKNVNVEVPSQYLSDYQNARWWQTMNLIPY